MACLNFIILKVNGKDVSNLAHEDAVNEFLKASEPILVEVKRRQINSPTSNEMPQTATTTIEQQNLQSTQQTSAMPKTINGDSLSTMVEPIITSSSTETASIGIQTDFLCHFHADYTCASNESPTSSGHHLNNGQTNHNSRNINNNNNHNHLHHCNMLTDCIKEVTLRKSTSDERIGLTVSYSSGNGSGSGSDDAETCTEVYISDIMVDSVAARDGRLRQGDQILQVNGRDVSTKEDAETLFSENKNAVTLLVSRSLFMGEEFSDNDNADYFDEYERIHNSLYQNGYLQHVFNSGDFNASASGVSVGDDNQNVDNLRKTMESSKNATNTSSSKSSSSNQSELVNLLPHYQPRWHQQLNYPSFAVRNPLHPSIIKAHLDSVNQEIAQLDSRIESVLLKQHQAMNQQALTEAEQNSTIYRSPVDSMITATDSGQTNAKSINNTTTVINSSAPTKDLDNKFASLNVSASTAHSNGSTTAATRIVNSAPRRFQTQSFPAAVPPIDSDTEHIYETIPEDSESEPIYCSPYKGDTDCEQNLLNEWLDVNDKQSNQKRAANGKNNWTRSTKSNSSIEDHENSSSAYNTGGSCNSNHQLTLELSDTNNGDDGNKTLVFCPSKHLQPKFSMQQDNGKQHPVRLIGSKKEKVVSPTHNSRRSQNQGEQSNGKKSTANFQDASSVRTSTSAPILQPTGDTMYTNMANLQQTILLQQRMFLQALCQQNGSVKSPPTIADAANDPSKKHYTAPSLSQYRFVSGQQAYTHTIQPQPSEERMEWKVKRRQDGTRYIVRRPVRNRTLRAARASKINEERSNDQTTEDDTISEVKMGRYWSKEDRKKHMEKSKERRHRQESLIAAKNQQMNDQQPQLHPMHTSHIAHQTYSAMPQQSHHIQQQQQHVAVPIVEKKTLKKKKESATTPHDNQMIGNNRNSSAPMQQTTDASKLSGLLSVTTV